MPLEQEPIRARVLEIIKTLAPEMDTGKLVADAPLRKQIDLDSMDWLNVLAAIHERLGVNIPEADYSQLGTLDSIVAYLAARLSRRTQG
ncbi:MAG TPA: acyl carrier protein [Candidatus Accumulibacter phosphatis]|nr:MAG: acyl carrier protein [Candidatus Accumulibacter sp. SK-11]HAY28275.1 acyl carrier protein [Accumulibacter sp.]HCN69299.1 acyl carrier protein [Accumulibacter sp.]HRL74176.1 acyl carrier protein [Candidatus Accumulibacter phosphatis]HRQ94733.1 acyl carrier protein [Candidatus Accumulibacter phosphatis]